MKRKATTKAPSRITYRLKEVAVMTSIPASTLRSRIRAGQIKAITCFGPWLISKEELDRLLSCMTSTSKEMHRLSELSELSVPSAGIRMPESLPEMPRPLVPVLSHLDEKQRRTVELKLRIVAAEAEILADDIRRRAVSDLDGTHRISRLFEDLEAARMAAMGW